jgi:hypothetical protein
MERMTDRSRLPWHTALPCRASSFAAWFSAWRSRRWSLPRIASLCTATPTTSPPRAATTNASDSGSRAARGYAQNPSPWTSSERDSMRLFCRSLARRSPCLPFRPSEMRVRVRGATRPSHPEAPSSRSSVSSCSWVASLPSADPRTGRAVPQSPTARRRPRHPLWRSSRRRARRLHLRRPRPWWPRPHRPSRRRLDRHRSRRRGRRLDRHRGPHRSPTAESRTSSGWRRTGPGASGRTPGSPRRSTSHRTSRRITRSRRRAGRPERASRARVGSPSTATHERPSPLSSGRR